MNMEQFGHLAFVAVLLVNLQWHFTPAQNLNEVLKLQGQSEKTSSWEKKRFFPSLDANEFDIRLSSWPWSIRVALNYCLPIQHAITYRTFQLGVRLCLKGYYRYCTTGNSVTNIPEMKPSFATECMRIRFSEAVFSCDAKTWDIQVPAGFNINLTVKYLEITYHPNLSRDLIKNGNFLGHGLAIGNFTAVGERTKYRSYLLPANKVKVILNYAVIPDRPVLQFLFEAIIPHHTTDSYETSFVLRSLHVIYFENVQEVQPQVLYLKTWIRQTVSLTNITLFCPNNVTTAKRLAFIDGPIFLVGSYLQQYGRITSLDCDDTTAASVTNASLEGNEGRYLYKDEVMASIGDLTILLRCPHKDISAVNFRFNSHQPRLPFGHNNVTDYGETEPTGFSSLLASVILPTERRHFHIMLVLRRTSQRFLSSPRLVFHIKEFDVVSFQDQCYTGGIFIAEGDDTVAKYCSIAGLAFLNGTTQRGGILFQDSPLIIVIKGYSWFAKIRLNISVSYHACRGVINVCEKLRSKWIIPNMCGRSNKVQCVHMTPAPCIEIAGLASDGIFVFPKGCKIFSHLESNQSFKYVHFPPAMVIEVMIESFLELEDRTRLERMLDRIQIEGREGKLYLSEFDSKLSSIALNKYYKTTPQSAFIHVVNKSPLFGTGYRIRLRQLHRCAKQGFGLYTSRSLAIFNGCGTLLITPTTRRLKITIDQAVFQTKQISYYNEFPTQFLNIAFRLRKAEQERTHNRTFNVQFHWSFAIDERLLQKKMFFWRRRYLEIKVFSLHGDHRFSVELEMGNCLDQLEVIYTRRTRVAETNPDPMSPLLFRPRLASGHHKKICFGRASSCYVYQKASMITWNGAQAHCAEQQSNLVSINSPKEWHTLLGWTYKSLSYDEVFTGQPLIIGHRKIHVSKRFLPPLPIQSVEIL